MAEAVGGEVIHSCLRVGFGTRKEGLCRRNAFFFLITTPLDISDRAAIHIAIARLSLDDVGPVEAASESPDTLFNQDKPLIVGWQSLGMTRDAQTSQLP